MAFNTVGVLLRFVSLFQLRLNSDNSDRPFLHENLFVLMCLPKVPLPLRYLPKEILFRAKWKKKEETEFYTKFPLPGLLPGLEVIT